jgi:hypothetical protein
MTIKQTLDELKNTAFFHVLDLAGKLLAPGAIALAVCKVLKLPDSITYAASLSLFVVSVAILFGKKYLKQAWISLLFALCLCLAAALGASTYRRSDSFDRMSRDFAHRVDECRDDPCIAKVIAAIPRPASLSPIISLSNDLRAATICLQNSKAAKMLDTQLGIKASFIGAGLTDPSGQYSYSAARIPEYLVPNYEDTKNCVWTWQIPLETLDYDQTLKDLIKSRSPMQQVEGRRRFEDALSRIEQGLTLVSDTPSVVRLAQFPAWQYTRHLGRQEARWVFTIHLGAVWELKIRDIAKYSGYKLTVSRDSQDTLFIWIVTPFSPDEVVAATWGNIFSHITDWIQ